MPYSVCDSPHEKKFDVIFRNYLVFICEKKKDVPVKIVIIFVLLLCIVLF